ncbi:flagellar biosynthesis protein FlgI [Helicobacter sp. MIT 00-7814]|uniref:flagellar basal body P-ring protein FlgI n=1 Tax=unclassified Helicobacter TaxID=2593540 RepID=UPI000E1E9094|nr:MULTISPECIES: flagellar basal body P-ring protein FlgI [unclassified Helicobacter]RDU55472.1 flagellar biosynthesis protein FlgI [Helicobacter sp. MIT 99-10781]RDU55561.1 flagellar biosynthesis protein FlgI [Helicobacter sp. MIT 00-7814]
MKKTLLLFGACLCFVCAQKVSDLAQIVGIRENSLIGYGLVIGLNGSGDKNGSKFTAQSMANMLESMNVKLSPNDIKSKNVAAVMVTANMPAFARQGDKIDIQVSSIGDAKSITGGTLVLTPLSAVDGNIYALAQGALTQGNTENTLSATLIGGATIEREIAYNISQLESATLSLKKSDLQNAVKIQQALNETFNGNVASAQDSRTIRLNKPEVMSMVEFLALVEEVEVDYLQKQRVVIDEKSGTIIAGLGITIEPIVLTHGDLTLKISQDSQEDPNALNLGDDISISQTQNTLSTNGKKPTLANVVRALQKMGASPKNIVSILETMKRSGAITAEIEVI